jgi:NAD(P)-dependent dehydrogenase (short-subunit alcohol dehydrogenase family)
MSKERVVVVTGGASGIGLGVTRLFVGNGHPVAMLDINEQTLEQESTALRKAGAKQTMSVETWQRMIDVNLIGVFHTLQPASHGHLRARASAPARFLRWRCLLNQSRSRDQGRLKTSPPRVSFYAPTRPATSRDRRLT